MGEHDEQLVFEMGYNKGFKDGIKGSIPKAEIKKFLEEGTKDVGNNVLAIDRRQCRRGLPRSRWLAGS